jgi:hypothetical protein
MSPASGRVGVVFQKVATPITDTLPFATETVASLNHLLIFTNPILLCL